jgi:hypothetical protein
MRLRTWWVAGLLLALLTVVPHITKPGGLTAAIQRPGSLAQAIQKPGHLSSADAIQKPSHRSVTLMTARTAAGYALGG